MKRQLKLLTCLLLSAGLLACGDDVDHASVEQAVYDGTDSAVDAVIDSLVLLETSAMYEDASSGECWGEGPDGESHCDSATPSAEDLEVQYGELRDELGERFFNSDNIEDSSSGSLTYLLHGDVVCQEEDFFDEAGYDYCVEDIDALEIRLHAELVDDDAVAIELWLGPDEIHPLTFTFGPQQLNLALVLDGLEPAANFVAETYGEEFEGFAETLEGEVEFGYFADGDLRQFALSVHEDVVIEVDDGEYFSLETEGVGQVFSFGVDVVEEVLVGSTNLGEFSMTFEEWSSTAPGGSNEFFVQLAGLSSDVLFEPGSERIEWSDVGLGGGPATIAIDGEEVLHIDFNSGLGGLLNAVLQEEDEDTLKFSVDPGLELEIGTFFHRVTDTYDDFDDWMLDEVLTIALSGDDNPAVLIHDYSVEVLRGVLELDSASTDQGASVEAGMCLVEEFEGSGQMYHPFEELEEAQCSD